MITGSVNSRREAVVSLSIRGPDWQLVDCEAVVDTGFNGSLALPPHIISALRLPRIGVTRAVLGDGNEATLDLYNAVIFWDGQEQSVEVDCIASDALVGTALLAGYELRVAFIVQGTVEITRLP